METMMATRLALSRLLAFPLLLSVATSQQVCTSAPPIRLVIGNCSIPGIAANGVQVGIGETVQAEICGGVSTVSNSTLLMGRELCEGHGLKNPDITRNQCLSRRGGPIDWNSFSAFNADDQISELTTLNPSWVTLMTLEGLTPFKHALKAPLHMGGRVVTLLEGLVVEGQNHSLPHIGVGSDSSLLTELVDRGVITGRSWGLNAGSQSYTSPREGSLVLGGKDDNSFEGNLVDFPFGRGERPVKRRQCPLQIAATDLTIRMSVNGTELTPLSYSDSTVTSGFCIESYDNHFRLGSSKVNDIVKAAGINLVNRTDYPDIYNMEEGLVFSSALQLTMSIEITIENKFTVTIPTHEIVNPLRGLNPEGQFALDPKFTEIGIFRSNPLEDSAVLGKAFLSQVYLFVDWDNDKFALAKQKQRSDIAPVLTPSGPCPNSGSGESGDRKMHIGFIVGMSVMGFIILAMPAAGFMLYNKYKKSQNAAARPPGAAAERAELPAVSQSTLGQRISAWAGGRGNGN